MSAGRNSEEQQPARRMVQLLNSHIVAQALYVAAQLGLPDLLRDGAKSVDALAAAAGAHAASLHRLLRMLAGEGVFREVRDGEFALTALGETLQSNSTNSVRDRALYLAAPEVWAAWGDMRHSVMTGEAAFEHLHGVSFYTFMSQHPHVGEYFNNWMTRGSELDNSAVVASYDFSQFRTVVDVGGGHGATLAAILRAYPSVRGILFDQPHVVSQATPLKDPALAGRTQIVGGDMIETVPAGGDAYVIKMVLNGESDERSIALLANCGKAVTKDGRLLVVDVVMPSGDEPSPSRSTDLFRLTLFRGSIRTEPEFRALFAAAGLKLRNIVTINSISSPMSILEAVPT